MWPNQLNTEAAVLKTTPASCQVVWGEGGWGLSGKALA